MTLEDVADEAAMPVATPCPAVAPITTPAGDAAAESAMVAMNDLSPHSAANTSANVESTSAPRAVELHPGDCDFRILLLLRGFFLGGEERLHAEDEQQRDGEVVVPGHVAGEHGE